MLQVREKVERDAAVSASLCPSPSGAPLLRASPLTPHFPRDTAERERERAERPAEMRKEKSRIRKGHS